MNDLIKGIEIDSQEAEEILMNAGNERINKAHKDGDLHPNGKWYWNASVNGGKGDWRVIKKTTSSKPVSTTTPKSTSTTDKPTAKGKQSTQAVNKITYMELKSDENTLSNSPDTQTKKILAAKYGVNSMKSEEIRKEVLRQLCEFHKKKTTFGPEDVMWFNKYWDYPSSPQKLRQAFKDESDEFLEFYKKFEEARYDAMPPRQRFHSISGKSLSRSIKALENIINDRKNENDSELKELLKNLNNETKTFHDGYIKRIEKYHSEYFDNLEKMKDFKQSDFLSFFGVMNPQKYRHIADKMKSRSWYSGLKTSDMNIWYKFHSDTSKPYTSSEKSITVFGQKYEPQEIRVATSAHAPGSEQIPASLPSKQAIDYSNAVSMMKTMFKFDKKKYVDKMKLDAEHKYQMDMMTVADKVRQMSMNESNLSVKSIKTSVKGFDIYVSDGVKTIYARSIYAAENSAFVAPHFRFIVTDRTNMK